MPDIFGNRQRQGSQGRPSDANRPKRTYANERYTCPPELHDRLLQYCDENERAKSWVIQKALDKWLTEQGY